MNIALRLIISIIAFALGGCLSQAAREYRELQNKRFNDEDVKTKMQQRAAALYPHVHARMRSAFDSGVPLITPKLVHSVQPKYPAGKAWREVQGGVWFAFVVGEDGAIAEIRALIDEEMPADPAFIDAALAAVEQWRFSPATIGGKTLPYILTVPVLFQLRDGL